MPHSLRSVEETLKALLLEHAPTGRSAAGSGASELGSTTNLASDLNMDSFALMEFLTEVEDHYDIVVDLQAVADTHTLGDLARVVLSAVGK